MRGRTDNHTILITIRHGADTAGGGHVSGHWYGHCYEYLSCVYGHVHVYGVYVHEHMCMRIGMYVYACGHVCKAGGLADCTALQAYVSFSHHINNTDCKITGGDTHLAALTGADTAVATLA